MSERETILRVRDLHKTFHIGFFRKRVEAVRGIDFDVEQGGIFGLLGPNGAGKTTTIKMILSLIFPTQGQLIIISAANLQLLIVKDIGLGNSINEFPIAQFYLLHQNIRAVSLIASINLEEAF